MSNFSPVLHLNVSHLSICCIVVVELFKCTGLSALRMQPDNVKAKYRRVQALYGLKRYREALQDAQEGMKKQPTVSESDLINE